MSPKSLQHGNLSSPTMFLLLGFSSTYRAQVTLCLCFSLIYLVTVLGNLLIMTLVWLDAHLHSPMYFFLGHLSFLDICYSSVTLPKILGDSLSPQKTISFVGCITQIYFFLCFGGSECILLAAMAYDRYLAICQPLHYPALMSKKMRHCLVAISWLSGSFSSLIQAFLTACLPFCGSNMIDHLFCEIPFLLKASCSPNALLNKAALYALAGTIAMGSFLLTLVSYVHIIRAVLQKGAGTQRAFATCTSHLTVVTLFFGTGAIAYLVPHSSGSKEIDEVLALLYAVVTPMLNPIIYSLRNSEVKGAIRKALHREVLRMSTKVAGIVLSNPYPPHCRDAALGDPTHMNESGTPGREVPRGAGGGTTAAPSSASPHPMLSPIIAQWGPGGWVPNSQHCPAQSLKAPSTAGLNLHCQLQKAQLMQVQPQAHELCLIPSQELGTILPVWSTAEVFTLSDRW